MAMTLSSAYYCHAHCTVSRTHRRRHLFGEERTEVVLSGIRQSSQQHRATTVLNTDKAIKTYHCVVWFKNPTGIVSA